jgi:HD-GYP domain-containing protein (c-di-GMP phosphodiesterase class II)
MADNCKNGDNLSGFLDVLHSFVEVLNAKDHYTEQHSSRVNEYSVCIAKALGLDDETIRCCRYAGLLHDIGKVGIPAKVLNKKGPLKGGEKKVIRSHPLIGEIFLSNGQITKNVLRGKIKLKDVMKVFNSDGCSVSRKIRETVFAHHERYNGTGYPRKLKGNKIPVTASILGIADSLDAMTTHRPYRAGMNFNEAVSKLSREQEKQKLFDPYVFAGFLRAQGDLFYVYQRKSLPE